MRANQLFILGLVTLSCVLATQTTFQASLASNAELKAKVEGIKAKENMGSIILSMAELNTEGRFKALFEAIAGLSAFLVKDRATENASFKEATAQWVSNVRRLTKARDTAKRLYEADNALLTNKLYPQRAKLVKLIASLEAQLKKLNANLAKLRADRKHEIQVYHARSEDYSAGVNACKRALPILQTLVNGQSFAEVDEEVFAQVSGDLKSSLAKLEMGALYTVFVDSMVSTLKQANFVDQAGLKKVIGLIQQLQARLEKGIVALDADEAANLKRFNSAQAALEKSIETTEENLKNNRQTLVVLKARILATEKHRDQQVALYKQAVLDLAQVNKIYAKRKADHKVFIQEVDREEETIAEAVAVLAKAGITKDA